MEILLVIIDGMGDGAGNSLLRSLHGESASLGGRARVLWFELSSSASLPPVAAESDALERIVLRHPEPLEYGEKVKLGLEYAQSNGVDTVVILDGRSRYPLDGIARMTRRIADGADMVLAVPASGVFRGGGFADVFSLPGARFAARLLNLLARGRLTGWHCGFRAYRVSALHSVPFRNNDPSRVFNTEIIIQFLLRGLEIAEMPMPGYKHQDMGLLDKARFAQRMIRASLLSLLHRMSIFYQPQYDTVAPVETYGLKLGYMSSHTRVLEMVPPGSRLLDIGCGSGALGEEFAKRGCEVYGLDQHDSPVSTGLAGYRRIDLDVREHGFDVSGYEYILLLDILEHLRSPESLLDHIRDRCGPGRKPVLIISVPNVAFFIIRLRLLLGTFHYGKLGILDLTHTRLFTESSIVNLLTRHGFKILSIDGVAAPYPKAIGLNFASRALLALNQWLINLGRKLFSYQIIVTACPSYTLEDILPPDSARRP